MRLHLLVNCTFYFFSTFISWLSSMMELKAAYSGFRENLAQPRLAWLQYGDGFGFLQIMGPKYTLCSLHFLVCKYVSGLPPPRFGPLYPLEDVHIYPGLAILKTCMFHKHIGWICHDAHKEPLELWGKFYSFITLSRPL